ncbi:ABC-three component system middle component 6 [Nannocystaceae bacterium ST9]
MILPTKGILPRKALLSVAGEILRVLEDAETVSRLWDDFRRSSDPDAEITFDWFVLALDLLYILGTIDLDHGRVRRIVAEEAS